MTLEVTVFFRRWVVLNTFVHISYRQGVEDALEENTSLYPPLADREVVWRNRVACFVNWISWIGEVEMNKIVGLLLVTAAMLMVSVTDLSAQKRLMGNPIRKDSLTVIEEREDRADQRAVFAVFLAWEDYEGLRPEINTALSIANTLAGPPPVQEVFDSEFADLEGTLEFYIWDYLGHLISPGYPFNRTHPGLQFSRGGSLEGDPGSAGARAPRAAWATPPGAAWWR